MCSESCILPCVAASFSISHAEMLFVWWLVGLKFNPPTQDFNQSQPIAIDDD